MTSTSNSRSSSRSFNPLPKRSQSPHLSNATTLRPRNNRLRSTELLGTIDDDTRSSKIGYGERNVLGTGRGLKPIPQPHLSRSELNLGGHTPKGKGIWEGGWAGSWTTLQGIASSVLGSGIPEEETPSSRAAAKTRRQSKTAKAKPSAWGPSGSIPIPNQDRIAAGSIEERDRAVRARKTASVLESHEGVNGNLDVGGRFKRRTSVDVPTGEDQDEEVMVYVHHVEPQDTVTGVILRYNCQPAPFRKANRLWPNDVLQIRKTVLLPLDACGVKGRPCNGPEFESGVDLLAPTPSAEVPPPLNLTNGGSWHNGTAVPSPFDPLPTFEPAKIDEEPQLWTHVRWVLISSSLQSKPVSIARIRRRDLGYFPPRRRKSTVSSIPGTPRDSLDFLSHASSLTTSQPPSSPRKPSSRRSSNLANRPPPTSYFPNITSHPGTEAARSSSTSSRARRDSVTAGDTQRSAWMRGPGGVGTLGKNVRKPGPAQDGLNNWATRLLPSLAIDDLPSRSILNADSTTWRIESITEEQRSFAQSASLLEEDGVNSTMGLENAASVIEGWVRRLATRVPGTPGTPRLGGVGSRNSGGVAPNDGIGDLIELLDGTGSDDGRGFEPTLATAGLSIPVGLSSGSGRDDLLGAVRGRTGKSGKNE